MPRLVTAHSNPLIRRVRALADKRHRRAEGLFAAEGLRIVAEAVEAGHVPVILLYAAESAAHPIVARIAGLTEAAGGEAVETTREILLKVTGKANPGAVVGVFPLLSRALGSLDMTAAPLWIACEALRDPGNLGTILRTADATGAGGVILVDNACDPTSPEAVRASMGAVFTVPVAEVDGAAFLSWARGGQVVGAALTPDAVDYQALRYRAPTILFMGNEQSGLPAPYAAACGALVKMPMAGKADSLNVAVATAVLAYEVVNQRRAIRPPG